MMGSLRGARAWIAAGLVLAARPAAADEPAEARSGTGSQWLWLLPGGGQLWLGQSAAGAAYAGGCAALAGWGVWAETRRAGGEVNAPLIYAQQLYVASFYAARRDLLLLAARTDRLDPAKMGTLARAPFAPAQLLNPWVLGFAAAGAGVNWLLARSASDRRPWSAIRSISYLGGRGDRAGGSAALGAYWGTLSWGAGEAEEMLFRGILQADWEERWGTVPGWLAASAVFGLAHLTSLRRADAWEQAGFAAVAGAWLGWRYRRAGHRLAEPIAAHVWLDVAAGLSSFAVDPRRNPLGARVSFQY